MGKKWRDRERWGAENVGDVKRRVRGQEKSWKKISRVVKNK